MCDDDDVDPNAPAGGCGPGASRGALPIGMDPAKDKWGQPAPLGVAYGGGPTKKIDPETRKLAAIAYGEASGANDKDEIGGIAFAVANRARAWDGKKIDELLAADPHYTYAVSDGNVRYAKLMGATAAEIEKDKGMSIALDAVVHALANSGADPSNGAYWWDGVDFKTNPDHPKVLDGFHYGASYHDIFKVKERAVDHTTYWCNADSKGKLVKGKERGKYSYVWVSTAAHGKSIFWLHDQDYLKATGGKDYR